MSRTAYYITIESGCHYDNPFCFIYETDSWVSQPQITFLKGQAEDGLRALAEANPDERYALRSFEME